MSVVPNQGAQSAPSTSTSTGTESNNSTCPTCGASFTCGALAKQAQCWCMDLPQLATEQIDQAASCFCPFCLRVKAVLPLNDFLAKNIQFAEQLDAKINGKTMPRGALGRLIEVAQQLATIQQTLTPQVDQVALWVFAGDHGLAKEGVSAYPQEVTWQMVENFLDGGAAINVFARLNSIDLKIVNAGVAHVFAARPLLIEQSMGTGTASSLHGPAMSAEQAREAISRGYNLVAEHSAPLVAFGEMGIANTSAAALLTARLCNASIEQCIGRGTGVDDAGLAHKLKVLQAVAAKHQQVQDPLQIAAALGGFEILMMAGAFIGAAANNKLALVDGYIATSAALIACKLNPNVRDYLLFAHQSAEPGHQVAMAHLKARPLIDLDLRLGEGTGAALAVPLVKAACAFLNEMASFQSAQVSEQSDN
jgi:nicotinate-nucleotide--dimethylbenzimidazole phosphoribosyltransferase